jgi:Fur family ferric uptake transcriptional regulator
MKQNIKQKARKLLVAAQLRCTNQRMAVLSALIRAGRPMTQEQISTSLGIIAPNKVTVYRILEGFVGAGLVHRVFLSQRTWHFELADRCTQNQCHPHFTCRICGDTYCLSEMSFPMARSHRKGFIIDRQRVQLEGLCPACSSRP